MMKKTIEIECSASALEAVRADFNPAKMTDVDELKQLAAAFITKCEVMRDHNGPTIESKEAAQKKTTQDRSRGRLASIAITECEDAAMWAVKAATVGK